MYKTQISICQLSLPVTQITDTKRGKSCVIHDMFADMLAVYMIC